MNNPPRDHDSEPLGASHEAQPAQPTLWASLDGTTGDEYVDRCGECGCLLFHHDEGGHKGLMPGRCYGNCHVERGRPCIRPDLVGRTVRRRPVTFVSLRDGDDLTPELADWLAGTGPMPEAVKGRVTQG